MIPRTFLCVVVVGTLTLPGPSVAFAVPQQPISVEPSELTKRPDLVGKTVVVDDRVARIQFHQGRDFDQIFLRRAPDFPFDLPERLRFKKSPRSPVVRVTGLLQQVGGRFWCEVSELELMPADLDRLNGALATMPRVDFAKRLAWVRWAESRANVFKDEALRARARQIETEVLRDEAARPSADPSSHWLSLADRAREHEIAEPEPSALAHLGFRAAIKKSTAANDLGLVVGRLEQFFPEAKSVPVSGAGADLSGWKRAYELDPAAAYRSATESDRSAMNRRLWVDAKAKWLDRKAIESPNTSLELAEEAAARLPERPELATSLLQKALELATVDPLVLTVAEVERLARIYRDRLEKPEQAKSLLRDWLFAQRRGLQATRNAESRIALAGQFERLANDREAALDLLREAQSLDPDSPQVIEAYLVRGFRKIDGRWSEAPAAGPDRGGETETGDHSSEPVERPELGNRGLDDRADALLGASPDQVRARMGGRPNRRVVSATQGQILEQWIYSDARESRYVNFLHRTGDSRPRVVSYFSLPIGRGRGTGPGD